MYIKYINVCIYGFTFSDCLPKVKKGVKVHARKLAGKWKHFTFLKEVAEVSNVRKYQEFYRVRLINVR